jgi:chloramphenicol 3-O-phosphotransferase
MIFARAIRNGLASRRRFACSSYRSRIPERAPLDRAEAGVGLVAESVITPTRRAMYLELFDGCSVMFVAVRCALPVAQAREEARSDRSHGALNLDAPHFERCISTSTT